MAAMRPSWGQAWPARPVRIILAHPAGSGVDAIARILADQFAKAWAQPVIVENKPGGQNTIGARAVAHSPPDGYTFYLATTAALVTNVYLFKELPYDPRKDFAPVGMVGRSPFGILVETASPLTSLQEFIDRARAMPGRVAVATEGPKTFGGLTARLFNSLAKVDTNLVSYASSGVALQDLMGGHADVMFGDLASANALIRQGKLRLLALTSAKRVPGWDVPLVADVVPGFDMVGWFALVAPASTPADAIARANRDLDAALHDPSVTERLEKIGAYTGAAGTPAELTAFLNAEHKRWSVISRDIGLLPE
jgi:tripartite-type tricarboxylate transporter receptor subunit TctC